MSCCPPGSWPALQSDKDYKPQGQVMDMGQGMQAYVVKGPGDACPCLISFQDIFAHDSARTWQVADQFAAEGFTVVHVDFLGQEYVQGDDLGEWFQKHTYDNFIGPKLVNVVLPFMSSTLGYDNEAKFGTIGFCYGTYMAFMAGADDKASSRLAASVGFHPSHKLHGFLDAQDPECSIPTSKVKVPQLFVAAGNDAHFVRPQGSIMKSLQSRLPTSKAVVFDAMKHGWVNRGDVTDKAVQEGVKDAIQLAVTYLKEHMK